ncbi:hypothetical protein FDP41_003306 [Naegleria fowleri]|uniref:GAF domain-containing protein n=1 Tax=Naegleria fowleri TaxID=5763 RepID=A0A6A5BUP0_NAEFO|nr:uncharacterized protein FDP41_003306 [Naegleria fowleri]KAF0977984.1 hypothetical protein FDP41_003306 [Naegleria fowleri]CAG4715700.1 unnamed protein product [Naegleria fowleri]
MSQDPVQFSLPLSINEQTYEDYLNKVGTSLEDISLISSSLSEINKQIDHLFNTTISNHSESFSSNITSSEKLLQLFKYDVPKKTPGIFTCSRAKDEKQFDLLQSAFGFGDVNTNDERVITLAKIIHLLYEIVNALQKEIQCEWLGIYKNINSCLYKLSYYGKFSRADFPIDEAHAKLSTNSFVALNGVVVTWDDVNSASDSGQPYYSCDAMVQSECCLPIFDETNTRVIGIIDAEAHSNKFFSLERKFKLLRACFLLRFVFAMIH